MTAIVLMSKDEARMFTDQLRERVQRNGVEREAIVGALRESEEQETWRILGYASMARYITVEFGYSRSNAYNILDQFKQAKRLGVSTGGQLPPKRESIAARQAATPMLKQPRAQKWPPSIDRYCDTIDQAIEVLTQRFEDAGEDALAYLPSEQRRRLERTVEKATRFTEQFAIALSQPAHE